jgi:hypothetical protein
MYNKSNSILTRTLVLNLLFAYSCVCLDNCNGQRFLSAFHLCCHGVVISKTGLGDTKCCGFQTFNPTWSMCCNGLVLDHQGKLKPSCCGQMAYDTVFEKCCFGAVMSSASVCRAPTFYAPINNYGQPIYYPRI